MSKTAKYLLLTIFLIVVGIFWIAGDSESAIVLLLAAILIKIV